MNSMMLLFVWMSGTAIGQEAPSFEQHTLVLLRAGPKHTSTPSEAATAVQAAHLSHLTRLTEDGKILVCGPFSDQTDTSLRGACVYATSTDEAKRLAAEDPAVLAGQLSVEVMSWWTLEGHLAFPAVRASAETKTSD